MLYIACAISFAIYLMEKYRKRLYIFSAFNISLFTYCLSLMIAPVFFKLDSTWNALGISYAGSMTDYMNKSFMLNGIGFLIFIMILMISEFYAKKRKRIINFSIKISNSISECVINMCFVFMILFWYMICLRYCNGLPLIKANRTFYLYTSVSSIYLFLNEGIMLCTMYYGITTIYRKKNMLFLFLGVFTVAMQGNRSSLFSNLLAPLIIIYIYHKQREKIIRSLKNYHKGGNINKHIYKTFKSLLRSSSRKLIFALLIIFVVAVIWQFIRNGRFGNITILSIFDEIINGNTFSDFRDGAYILKGFERKTNGSFLFGKTYLAAIISFIPSSISSFRQTWSWGRYTTYGLFGYIYHFGLRGGNAMEAYINFGWLGVVVMCSLQGYFAGMVENIFYELFIINTREITGKEYFLADVFSVMYGVICISSGAYNVYAILVLIFAMIAITSLLRDR